MKRISPHPRRQIGTRLPAALGLLLSIAAGVGMATAAPAPKQLLIIGQGTDGHPPTTHEFMAATRVLTELLKPYPALQTRVVKADEPWADGPKLIEQADGVVLFVTQGAQWMQVDPKRQAALRAVAARAGAIVAVHWSVGAKDAAYIEGQLELLGATRGGPQRKYQVLATELTRVAPEHPILRGIGDLKVYDEMYYALDRRPGIQPLFNAKIDGQQEMVAWAWERPDGGRSFGFVGLHFHANWQLPEYRRFIVQAVLWSLKLPIPQTGVNADLDTKFLELNGALPPLPGPTTTKSSPSIAPPKATAK